MEASMQHKLIHDDGSKTWAVILETGDEVTACLQSFATAQKLGAAHLTAIGAFKRAVLGYFEWDKKIYQRNPVDSQCEVVALLGDVALKDGEPKLHMHAVLGLPDGRAMGGHLLEGHVRPTLEVVLTETPAHLHRHFDADAGLALIEIGRETR
jgi:predicted DNA-binding protein with PD1-like motif